MSSSPAAPSIVLTAPREPWYRALQGWLPVLIVLVALYRRDHAPAGPPAPAPPDALAPVRASASAWYGAIPAAYREVAAKGRAGAVKAEPSEVGAAIADALKDRGEASNRAVFAAPDPWAALEAAASAMEGK